MKHSWFFVLGLIFLGIIAFGASGSVALAQNNPVPVDHFWCYETVGAVVSSDIRLQDFFYAADIDTVVGQPFRFCNPVEKHFQGKNTPIANPYSHLKMYVIRPVSVSTRTVVVTNQFGTGQVLEVKRPVVLAVPTQKDTLPPPANLDHFLCYEADGLSIRNGRVRLQDQFRTEEVKVLKPFLFCNAAEEVGAAGGVVTPILHPGAHLVCYFTTTTPYVRIVVATNRFGGETSSVSDADLFCVPSQML